MIIDQSLSRRIWIWLNLCPNFSPKDNHLLQKMLMTSTKISRIKLSKVNPKNILDWQEY